LIFNAIGASCTGLSTTSNVSRMPPDTAFHHTTIKTAGLPLHIHAVASGPNPVIAGIAVAVCTPADE